MVQDWSLSAELRCVADGLRCIAEPPNRRQSPVDGDIAGRFDFWFDGGACRAETGLTRFLFVSGMTAQYPVTPGLNITFEFPNGARILLERVPPNCSLSNASGSD